MYESCLPERREYDARRAVRNEGKQPARQGEQGEQGGKAGKQASSSRKTWRQQGVKYWNHIGEHSSEQIGRQVGRWVSK